MPPTPSAPCGPPRSLPTVHKTPLGLRLRRPRGSRANAPTRATANETQTGAASSLTGRTPGLFKVCFKFRGDFRVTEELRGQYGSPHSASPRHGSPTEARSGTRCCRRASQASPGRPSSSCGCGRCPFPPTSAVRAGVHSQTPHATPALRRKPTAAPRDLPGSAPRPVCPRPLEGPRFCSARCSLSVGRALQPAHTLDRSSLGPSFGITHSGPARCWALTLFWDHRRGAPFREHP